MHGTNKHEDCKWVVTRWQWLFYMYTEYEIGCTKYEIVAKIWNWLHCAFLLCHARYMSHRSPISWYNHSDLFYEEDGRIMNLIIQLLIIWRWLICWNWARSCICLLSDMHISCRPWLCCCQARPSYSTNIDGSQTEERIIALTSLIFSCLLYSVYFLNHMCIFIYRESNQYSQCFFCNISNSCRVHRQKQHDVQV